MHFEADLDIVVDGTSAHVRGAGPALVLDTSDPSSLTRALRAAAGAPTRHQLTAVADTLAAQGVSVHIEGPRGRFVTVGADADSAALGLFTGSRHLVPGWPAFASSSLAVITQRRRLVAALAALAVAAGLALHRSRRAA